MNTAERLRIKFRQKVRHRDCRPFGLDQWYAQPTIIPHSVRPCLECGAPVQRADLQDVASDAPESGVQIVRHRDCRPFALLNWAAQRPTWLDRVITRPCLECGQPIARADLELLGAEEVAS